MKKVLLNAILVITGILTLMLFSINDFEISNMKYLVIAVIILAINVKILSKHKEMWLDEE